MIQYCPKGLMQQQNETKLNAYPCPLLCSRKNCYYYATTENFLLRECKILIAKNNVWICFIWLKVILRKFFFSAGTNFCGSRAIRKNFMLHGIAHFQSTAWYASLLSKPSKYRRQHRQAIICDVIRTLEFYWLFL